MNDFEKRRLEVLTARANQLMLELRRIESDNSLATYLRAGWPLIEPKHAFIHGWHIDAIAEHLEAVLNGEISQLIINIPPRHAKSTLVSVGFPSWSWTKRGELKFIYGSHSDSLVKRDSIKTRNIVQSEWYRHTFKPDWTISADQNEKKYFSNTAGGFRRSTTVNGAIIGEGGDILVLDDPHSPRSAKSDAKRSDTLEWIDEEFFTRINDPKTIVKILMMQRLDEKDASAHLLKQGGWEHLMLPAEFEQARKCYTSIGFEDPRTAEAEPLWKERFDADGLTKLKKMGAKAWAGQGQQRPAPADGNIFKRKYLSQFYTQDPKELALDMDFIGLSVDLPFSEGGTFAVYQLWGSKGSKLYLLDQTRDQVGFNQQRSMFKAMIGKWPIIHAKWIEKKANGAAMIETMQADHPALIPITPRGSKEVRAEASSPRFEAGDVWLPDPSIAPWINDYIEELVAFPNGLNDDQVDATSQALLKLAARPTVDAVPILMNQKSKFYGRR